VGDKSLFLRKIAGTFLDLPHAEGRIMKTAFGAVGGALAVGAMLVSYNLGERQAFARAASPAMSPTMQMLVGPDGVARPYLVHAGQSPNAFGQPYGPSPYGTMTSATAVPFGYSAYPAYQGAQPVQTQYVTERVVSQPTVRRVSTQRASSEVRPRRSWQKSALLIGGSAGAGAGVGALMGGKKGALAGAAIGGGAAAIYDQVKRH
jgi:hypothetical protein